MTESPTQHRQLVPGPSPQDDRSLGTSPTEERRSSTDATKKRCSGERPCDNCLAFNRNCEFDETLDQRRRVAARRTANELNYHRELFGDLLKVLRIPKEDYTNKILEIIRREASHEELRSSIDEMLKIVQGGTETIHKLEALQPSTRQGSKRPSRPSIMDIDYMCSEEPPYKVPAQPWTNVTTDSILVSRLVSLYFTWDYPTHAFLDRDVFLKHMQGQDPRSPFCSPFLVNALLANATQFVDDTDEIKANGDEFLAEAETERSRVEESGVYTLAYLQGLLMLYERHSAGGRKDLGYEMLHLAIRVGEHLGLVGRQRPYFKQDQVSEDMDLASRRTAWGLFYVETHDQHSFWAPYPRLSDAREKESYLSEYLDQSCKLCNIAREMSENLFADGKSQLSADQQNNIKEKVYQNLRGWNDNLPIAFTIENDPPPYILTMKMRYYTMVINLFLYHAEDEILGGTTPEGIETPESPTTPDGALGLNKRNVAQSAAKAIAVLARKYKQLYGMRHAHQYTIYAINLALFVLVEQRGVFDVLDSDFLFLASAFASIANRCQLGRNVFHMFRQNVRAKCQGKRLRESTTVDDGIKILFDEECTAPSEFDAFAIGLEKLDADERYRVRGQYRLSDMLDRYETLSLGKDLNVYVMDDPYRSDRSSFSSAANNPNASSLSPNPNPNSNLNPNVPGAAPPEWIWRAGPGPGPGSSSAVNAPGVTGPAATYPMPFSFGPTMYPDITGSVPLLGPVQDGIPAPKIAIPRATAVKAAAHRRRSARACEPCRQRKVKCDAGRPECRKCREHGLTCSYIDIKRIRDQKQLGVLGEKVEKYEKLLKEIEEEVESGLGRKIRRALTAFEQATSDDGDEADDSNSDSATTHGSLEEIDLVKEDLNRSDKTVAVGFFGKNSEVAWMQKLEDESAKYGKDSSDSEQPPSSKADRHVPIMSMSYHLDDLSIPFSDSTDPFAVPSKELADLYFNAYMDSVHSNFTVVRKNTFTSQYESFYKKKAFGAPRKWLAVLNMIFALGCRFCKLAGEISPEMRDTEDTEFLDRARKLCLTGNVLFEHDDLQQIQVMLLVAVYLVALGQVNGASKFSSMALHSAISLGINLRFKDDKTPYASKEARTRLWWSIFSLEHLITSITGRISGCGESLSAADLPVPFEEEGADKWNLGLGDIFRDPELQANCLQLTLFQNAEQAQSAAAWISKCSPSPTLVFHCIVDLTIIAQAVINSVYSIQGLRETSGRLEQQLQKHSRNMDIWLKKIPLPYRFFVSPEDDSLDLSSRNDEFARERISLAIHYYSARITLCRPCLSHTPSSLKQSSGPGSKASYRALMTLACLRAATIMLSILPDQPDTTWLTTMTPWWAILHHMMQATTALLIGLSTGDAQDVEISPGPQSGTDGDGEGEGEDSPAKPENPASTTNTTTTSSSSRTVSVQRNQTPIKHLDRASMIHQTTKALHWLHHLAHSSRAARRAFILCERFLKRMGPSLGLDVEKLPSSDGFPPLGEEVDMTGMGSGSGSGSGSSEGNGSGSGTGTAAGAGIASMGLAAGEGSFIDDGLAIVDD
ncbi:fungal-specific transcription factor domain-containing protein [Aspergillus filifer]